MDGCFGLSPNHLILSKRNILLVIKTKATATPIELLQPFFRNKKITSSVRAASCVPTFKQFS